MEAINNRGKTPVDLTSSSIAPGLAPNQSSTLIYHKHPLFLTSYDINEMTIISFQLNDTENYVLWRKTMKISLLGRSKLGFIDGCLKKISQCNCGVFEKE